MERRRSVTAVAALLLLLVGVACGAPAGDGASDGETDEPAAAPTTAPATTVPGPRPTSDLADRVEPLDSARYDPAEHEAATRTVTGLSLPVIGVDGAPVEPVGVEPNGEMEIPPAEEVGWYRFGAAPGESGSAVLAAHIAYDG
ncbi:MAG TPA: hypothetical protein DCS55_22175, partial [Acidimicrobiaceae bacterium]|nr:hypothetical protein [Acidimicrobiaceae bacterium]